MALSLYSISFKIQIPYAKRSFNLIGNLALDDYSLLILDDLGVERNTEYALEQMFLVIDSRYRSRKPLIVTTNLKLEEIRNPPALVKQIGRTTYIVRIHFSEISTETMSDKIKRMLRNEIRQM